MAINFPASPTLNQTYTFNGRTWTWNGVGWQATGASGLSVYTKTDFTATASQTTFSVTYTVGFIDVYYNGSKLSLSEYTATNGTSVVLGTACASGDIVETVAWTVSTTLNPALGVATATSLAIGGATIGTNALAVTGTTLLNSALTYGGVTLSNAVTGTGNMVLSASPTLTGTLTGAAATFSSTLTSGALLTSSSSVAAQYEALRLAVTGSANYPWMTFYSNGTRKSYLGHGGNTDDFYIQATAGNVVIAPQNTSGVVTVTGTSLGIGMTPSNVLDITQNQNAQSTCQLTNSNGSTASSAQWRAFNGTHTAIFGIYGTGYTTSGLLAASATLLYGTSQVSIVSQNSFIAFATNGTTEKARFGTDGSFLVNTTTNGGWGTDAKIEAQASTGCGISGYATGAGGASLRSRGDTDTTDLIAFYRSTTKCGSFISSGGGTPNIQWLANNQAYVIAGGSGGVTLASAATAWAAISDETLKTDLATIQSGAEKVGSLRAVTGRYKTDAESMSRSFLIAQDVQKVLPEAVSTDADGTLSLRYTEVIPLMVAAIQELTTRLAALENK